MEMIYCETCGLPQGLHSNGIEDAFTPESIKLRQKFRDMKKCQCKTKEANPT